MKQAGEYLEGDTFHKCNFDHRDLIKFFKYSFRLTDNQYMMEQLQNAGLLRSTRFTRVKMF